MRVIGDIARLNAKRNPNKKALIMGEDSLTYGQLNQMANQLAHGLLSKGVSPGDRIAVLAHNCLEAVVINYAVSKCGGIVVPANFRYKKDELIYLINDCEPRFLLFGGDFSSLVEEAKPRFSRPVGLVAIFGEPLRNEWYAEGFNGREINRRAGPGCRPHVGFHHHLHERDNRCAQRGPCFSFSLSQHLSGHGR